MTKNIRILASQEASKVIGTELTRRGFLGVSAAGGVTFLAACAGGGAAPEASGGDLESALSIYTWAEYDDPTVFEDFTSEFGPSITVDAFNSNEEAIAKLATSAGTSGYDIVVPTGVFIPQMVEQGLLAPLNKDLIPNMSNVAEAFLGPVWDPENEYSVIKDWGSVGYIWDTTVIDRDIVTWNDFIDVAQNEASGSTSLLDVPGDIAGIYFWANDIDWTTTDEAHLAAAEEFLVNELAPHVSLFDSNPGTGSIVNSTAALFQVFNGDARLGLLESSEPEKWKFAIGAPATELWSDNWCIVADAQHPEAAHAFINYVLDPEISLRELEYIGYDTGIEGLAEEAADMEYADIVFFDEETVATFQLGAVNEAQQRLVEIYNAVKAAAGA